MFYTMFMKNYACEMTYTSPVTEKSAVSLVPYSKEYQEQYKKLYNACYHEMREALGIRPYDFIQDDSFFDEGMDQVYILTDGGELIGSVALKGNEIDDLLVNITRQGQGYGRQILLWAIGQMQEKEIILHVAEWNKRAINLYEKTGFEVTETFEIR